MGASVDTIPPLNLLLALGPVAVVLGIFYRWALDAGTALYAVARMVLQLLVVGYVLSFVFGANQPPIVIATLMLMLGAASWIALRPLGRRQPNLYGQVLVSIGAGGVLTLALVTQLVLALPVWYEPSVVIPLGGMIFATSMNTVSLAAERFQAESTRATYLEARQTALRSALIPQINSLLAVGLVSFPGMMTGQILSGVSPLIAVRYQIMVMSMLFGSAGLSAACYLALQRPSGR